MGLGLGLGMGLGLLAALVPVQRPADEVTYDGVPRRGSDEGGEEDAAREHGLLAVEGHVVRHGEGRDEARVREDELAHLVRGTGRGKGRASCRGEGTSEG